LTIGEFSPNGKTAEQSKQFLFMKTYIFIFNLLFATFSTTFIFSQENDHSTASMCENFNSFAKTERIEKVKPLVSSILPNGTLYLNPEKLDSIEFLFEKMGIDNGTTFEFVGETKSRLDDNKTFRRYQQFYEGVKVIGGGYTMAYIGTGPPTDPCGGVAYMLAPNVLTGISLDTRPLIEESSIFEILKIEKTVKPELVITHNLTNRCEYTLTWQVTYFDGKSKISWIDAQTGSIIKTFNATMNHNAPTDTYGNQFLTDLTTTNNVTTLESPDSRIVTYDFGATCPASTLNESEWMSTLVPSTTNATEWTTEADPKTFQAFWVASQVIPLFDGIDINFEKLNIANCDEENAFSLTGSTTENAFVAFGNIQGSTTALFDAVAHELGHTYLNQFLNYSDALNNAALHEGISDIIGTYIESLVPTNQGVDWVMGDDEPDVANCTCLDRDLENPRFDCVTTPGLNEQHERGMPIGHWYFLISQGQTTTGIPALGMEKALNILLESLNLVGRTAGYQELMQATLTTVQEEFGRCSNEFLAVARAWELICVPTGFTNSLGVVPPCSVSICGDNQVCEEGDHLKLCVCGVYPAGTHFRWTIIGKKSTEFKSEYGMQGNSQEGGDCLSLIDFPKYPYYPQYITIEIYSPSLGVQYIHKKRIKLVDCNGDDPTCEEYYEFRGDPSDERLNQDISFLSSNEKHQYIKVFDVMGRLLFEGASGNLMPGTIPSTSLIFLVYYDSFGRIIEVKKSFGLKN
jgi:Zn-dependent metalloprotease